MVREEEEEEGKVRTGGRRRKDHVPALSTHFSPNLPNSLGTCATGHEDINTRYSSIVRLHPGGSPVHARLFPPAALDHTMSTFEPFSDIAAPTRTILSVAEPLEVGGAGSNGLLGPALIGGVPVPL